jgi:methionyl-tRNA synthetase
MQSLEDENNRTVIEAAGGVAEGATQEIVAPVSATASPSVISTTVTSSAEARAEENTTHTTAASMDGDKPIATAKVHQVPAELASSRLTSTPVAAQTGARLPSSETAAASDEPTHISIDDFAKVELRVAQILVAERVPKADKLLRLEVDLGYEKRQILAGIAQYYEPETLIGRKIIIVANLAPRKMRGLESNGMLLAASLEGGAPVLAGFLEECPLGARLK